MKKQPKSDKPTLVYVVLEIPENEIEGIIEQFKNSKKVKFKYWWKDQEWRKENEIQA